MALIGALEGFGARIGGAMEKMVASQSSNEVESVDTVREDAEKVLRVVEKVNEWLDVFEATMVKESKCNGMLSRNLTPTSVLCLLGLTGKVATCHAYSVGLSFVRLSGHIRSAHWCR